MKTSSAEGAILSFKLYLHLHYTKKIAKSNELFIVWAAVSKTYDLSVNQQTSQLDVQRGQGVI